jgi:hypothetical protein
VVDVNPGSTALQSHIQGLTEMTARQYFRLGGILRENADDEFLGIEFYMSPDQHNRLEAVLRDIDRPSPLIDNIRLSQYMTGDEFLAFVQYMASREYVDIPGGMSIIEYLGARSLRLFGFEIYFLPRQVRLWLTAVSNITVEEYSRLHTSWLEWQVREMSIRIGGAWIPTILDLVGFRLLNLWHFPDPVDMARLLSRVDNIIDRMVMNQFSDLSGDQLNDCHELFICLMMGDGTWSQAQMRSQLYHLRHQSLKAFIHQYDCAWKYMARPYTPAVRPQRMTRVIQSWWNRLCEVLRPWP